jgi:hypothetical protein
VYFETGTPATAELVSCKVPPGAAEAPTVTSHWAKALPLSNVSSMCVSISGVLMFTRFAGVYSHVAILP